MLDIALAVVLLSWPASTPGTRRSLQSIHA